MVNRLSHHRIARLLENMDWRSWIALGQNLGMCRSRNFVLDTIVSVRRGDFPCFNNHRGSYKANSQTRGLTPCLSLYFFLFVYFYSALFDRHQPCQLWKALEVELCRGLGGLLFYHRFRWLWWWVALKVQVGSCIPQGQRVRVYDMRFFHSRNYYSAIQEGKEMQRTLTDPIIVTHLLPIFFFL